MTEVVEELVIRLRAEVGDLRTKMGSLTSSIEGDNKRIVISSEEASAQVAVAAKESAAGMQRLGTAVTGLSGKFSLAMKGILGFWAVMEARRAVGGLIEANIAMQQIQYTLEYATGSAAAASKQLKFLDGVSQSLGINLQESGLQFAKMLSAAKGQGLSDGTIQSLYLGLAKTFDILHSKTQQQQRVMQAFSEMLTMGKIHAQQLQLMLGRDLPGVNFIQIAAHELHITQARFEQLLRTGNITAQELMPALAVGLNLAAEKGSALSSAIHGTNATLNRLHNAVFEAKSSISDALVPAIAALADATGKSLRVMVPLNTTISESRSQFRPLYDIVYTLVDAFMLLVGTVKMLGSAAVYAFVQFAAGGRRAFEAVADYSMVMVHGFELAERVVVNFAKGMSTAFVAMRESAKAALTGHFAAASGDVKEAGQSFKDAFTKTGDIHAAMGRIGNDFKDLDAASALFASVTALNQEAAGKSITGTWSSMVSKLRQVKELESHLGEVKPPNVQAQTPKMVPATAAVKAKAYLATLHTELLAAATGSKKRVELAKQEVALSIKQYGKLAPQYQLSLRDLDAAMKEHTKYARRLGEIEAAQQRQSELAKVAVEKEELGYRQQLGQIGAEKEVRSLIELESRKYQIELKALRDRIELVKEDALKRAQLVKEAEALYQKYGAKITQLNQKTVLDVRNDWIRYLSTISRAFDESIKGMIRGTTTWHRAMRHMFQSILGEFIDMAVRMGVKWIATQIALTSVTAAGAATRGAIDEQAEIKSIAIAAAAAVKRIAIKAWEVIASVYSAIAGIPYVGPFLAPVMAIAAGAYILSLASRVASAAGGWEVPSDQLAMVHKDEMILPAHIAQPLKHMAQGSGSTVNLHVHAVDGESVRRLLLGHGPELAEALTQAHRNGLFA